MITLSPRLQTALPFVRPGHLLADVGTDHAYLPIFLCQSGRLLPVPTVRGSSLCALAADINQGPVDRATIHISAAGLSDRILPIRTGGLHGLEVYHPTDIIIFGMGGELIASILDAAPWVRDPAVRLILQPMTHPEKLRTYLSDRGFSLVGEILSREDDRIYQTVCAAYGRDGLPLTDYTPAERLTGRAYPAEQAPLHQALIRKAMATTTACRDAKAGAGRPTKEEDILLADLARLLAASASC